MSYLTPQQALNHAMDRHVAGQLDEAEAIYRHLLASDPGNVDVLHLLGVLTFTRGQFEPAIEIMRRSIAMSPAVPRFHNNLGNALIDIGRFDEAITALEMAVRLDPTLSAAYYNLGNALSRLRRWEEAVVAYRRSLELRPDFPGAILNLGTAFAAMGQLDATVALYREALAKGPPSASIATNLGNALRDQGDMDAAIETYEWSLRIDPNDAVARSNLGNALKDQGAIDAAIAAFRRSLELKPEASETHSNLVFTLYFDPECPPAAIAAEQRAWDRRHAQPLRAEWRPPANERSPERKLRIGYVSPDLRDHVVGRSLLPVFEEHDHEGFEFTCYTLATPDHVTARFQARADHWRDLNQLSDAQVAELVRADGIDILVDLALHTAHNSLLAFARKPAPVQVSWLGYPGTAGIEAIDYHLTDRFLEDGSSPGAFPLPGCWGSYAHYPDSPAVNALPAASRDRVTFGSFNNFCKMNDRVWDLWAQILAAVEGSRLVLLAKAGSHEDRTREKLKARGIDPQRIEFLRYVPSVEERPQVEFLRRYHEIDIALDPFPYNGMTTTCDALWMGVPVVALTGNTPIARASFSLLSNLGLPELASPSRDEYVRIAIALAKDRPRLAELRASLRRRMETSPLLDAKSLARHVENAYRTMWRRWCAS
ncbi:MAG: tetratricopeptide repeat protein [Chthoniobacteraceae bacterium]